MLENNNLTVATALRTQRGFNLIEALVALLILSIGLLGLAMLQVRGLQMTNESYFRTQATLFAYDLMDRIRANKTGGDAGNYCITTTGLPTCTTTLAPSPAETCGNPPSVCTDPASVARFDLTQWYQTISERLPPASSGVPSSIQRDQIVVGSTNVYQYTIVIRWREHDTDMSQQWVAIL